VIAAEDAADDIHGGIGRRVEDPATVCAGVIYETAVDRRDMELRTFANAARTECCVTQESAPFDVQVQVRTRSYTAAVIGSIVHERAVNQPEVVT